MTGKSALHRVSRRSLVAGGLSVLVVPSRARGADGTADHGRVKPPLPPPDIEVVSQDGSKARLPALLRGRASALHPMFTACRSTCPIQGVIFARVQKLLPEHSARGIQLVSLSVDPRRDTPAALRKWLDGFHARPGWIAAAPLAEADGATVRTFTGGGRNAADNHSTQVLIFNRDGMLVWRTFDLPEAEDIATLLQKV